MSQAPAPTPPLADAPPTIPGELSIPERPAAWPMVVGVVCIVFGALGALGGVWGVASQLMVLMGTIPVQTYGTGPTPDLTATIKQMAAPQIAAEAVKLLLGVLLILIGAAVTKRKPIARPAAIWWSLAKVIAAVVSTAIGVWAQYIIMDQVQQAMLADPNAPQQLRTVLPMVMFGTAGMIALMQLIWQWALPIFLLIWFTRPKVRTEVARWANRRPVWAS